MSSGFKCPKCGRETHVVKTVPKGLVVIRARTCLACANKVHTSERIIDRR
jgi:transcription elongation factor Elf1